MRGPVALIENGGEGDPPVVSIRGEIDVANLPALREWLASASEHGTREIVVDLEQVTFLAVGALYVLCDEAQRMASHRARMTIVSDRPEVVKVFEICRLDGVLHVVPSRDRAPREAWCDEDDARTQRLRAWIQRYERVS